MLFLLFLFCPIGTDLAINGGLTSFYSNSYTNNMLAYILFKKTRTCALSLFPILTTVSIKTPYTK